MHSALCAMRKLLGALTVPTRAKTVRAVAMDEADEHVGLPVGRKVSLGLGRSPGLVVTGALAARGFVVPLVVAHEDALDRG